MKTRIIIIVKAGLVETVYTDMPNVEVVVIDHDQAECGDDWLNEPFVFPLSQMNDTDTQLLNNQNPYDQDE